MQTILLCFSFETTAPESSGLEVLLNNRHGSRQEVCPLLPIRKRAGTLPFFFVIIAIVIVEICELLLIANPFFPFPSLLKYSHAVQLRQDPREFTYCEEET